MLSKFVKGFPRTKQYTGAVAKALLTDIIPRWGIPGETSGGNGKPFVSIVLKQVGEYLGIEMRHRVYQSSQWSCSTVRKWKLYYINGY